MLDAIMAPAVVALAGGLAFLAYNHPDDFREASRIPMLLCFMAGLLIMGWVAGLLAAAWTVSELLGAQEAAPIERAIMGRAPPVWASLSIMFSSLYLYLLILMGQFFKSK